MKLRTTDKNDLDQSEKPHKNRRGCSVEQAKGANLIRIDYKCGIGTAGKTVGLQKGHKGDNHKVRQAESRSI